MKTFLLLCLLVIFQANYSMEPEPGPEPGTEDIKIELLDDTPNLSNEDWMDLIYESWLEETEKNNTSSEFEMDEFRLDKTKILTDKKVNDIVLYFIRKGKNPNENNFVHRLTKSIDVTSEKQLKLFEFLTTYGADLHKENNKGKTPYKIALKRNLNIKGNWIATENPSWEENNDYLPPFVKNRYRCFPEYEKNGKITLCIVQGKGFFNNFEHHYDFINEKLHGFFQFAEGYAEQYNHNLEEDKKKAIHVLVFKLDKNAEKNLTAFLNSWHYRDDDYIFAALGYKCIIVNNVLALLAILQKNKFHQKNHGKKPNEIYKGIAELLLYFYPPCRQKYANNYKNYNPLNLVFNYINNEFAPNEPSFYDNLIVFYSKDDPIANCNKRNNKPTCLYSLTLYQKKISR